MPLAPQMRYSENGLALTKQFEGGPYLTPYRDVVGVWTNGWGNIKGVTATTPPITEAQAESQLLQNVAWAVATVNHGVEVALNQNQFDALVDFTFNLGAGALTGSTLLKRLNTGDYAGAAYQIPLWCHAGGQVVAGLVKRRAAERALFETPV